MTLGTRVSAFDRTIRVNRKTIQHMLGQYVTVWDGECYRYVQLLEYFADTGEVRVLPEDSTENLVVQINCVHLGHPSEIDGSDSRWVSARIMCEIEDDRDEDLVKSLFNEDCEQGEFLDEISLGFVDPYYDDEAAA